MQVKARRWFGVAAAAAMAVNTACYSFVPPGGGIMPAAGEHVRVHLTPEGRDALAQFLGPRVEWAEGTLASRDGDGTIVVGVQQVRLVDGSQHFWTGVGVVTMAPAHVAEVHRRTLDKARTRNLSIAVALAFIGLGAIGLNMGGARGAPDAGGTPPPP